MAAFRPPYYGAAYYPEDWPLEQIDEDIALMKEAGMNAMRIGEFAWSRMEPEEGKYDFDWLHLTVDKLGKADIAVIMGTPTCTPPVWLVEKYPEVLFTYPDGRRAMHGARRHTCPNNPKYRDLCEGIVKKMAEEFGGYEQIIGWQIDNELYSLSWEAVPCCCPVCVQKFRGKMKERFGTIEELNRAWGTDLWSQTYLSFDQLPIPDPNTWHHPSLKTAWSEFHSDSYVDFARHQAHILHRLVKQPVGTDMMSTPGLDYGAMHEFLDVVQHNHYHSMDDVWQAAFWFDLCRPLKGRPFWNTETSTCWPGGVVAYGYREPGFCTANTWLAYATGAEAALYWLWRQHWSGQEIVHGSVVSSHGRPMHIWGEVQRVAKGLQASADFLNNTRPSKTGLALHFSHLAAWMSRHQPLAEGFSCATVLLEKVYHPMIQAQLRPDVILSSHANLSDYKVIVSPFVMTLDEGDVRERLKAWIEAGGTWIVGPMSDTRSRHAAKFAHAPYGSLEEWAGVRCKYEIPGKPRDFKLRWADGTVSEGSVWYEVLDPTDAEVLAAFAEGQFSGLAAVTRKKVGNGQIIVLGTLPQPDALKALLLSTCREGGVKPVAVASENLLVVPREGKGGAGMVVVELENRAGTLALNYPVTDLLTGEHREGRIQIAPYSVLVLREE